MTRASDVLAEADATAFARDWLEGWNARDLDRVLSHWAEDCTFSSPLALRLTGSATVQGKQALRSYWAQAIANAPDLRFDLHTISVGVTSLILGYRNHRGQEVAELIELNDSGHAISGSVHYSHEMT